MKTKLLALLGAYKRALLPVFIILAALMAAAFDGQGVSIGLGNTLWWRTDGTAQNGSLSLQAKTTSQSTLVTSRLTGQTGDIFAVRDTNRTTNFFAVGGSGTITASSFIRLAQRQGWSAQNVAANGTIAAGGGSVIRYTGTSAGASLNLPTSPQDDQIVIIQDVGGVMSANPVTLVAGTSPLNIDGQATYSLNVSRGSWLLRYQSGGTWSVLFSPGSSSSAVRTDPAYGARFIRQWRIATKFPARSNSGNVANLGWFGDSWIQENFIYGPAQADLRAALGGNGGVGFFSLHHNSLIADGVTVGVGGASWTIVDGSSSAGAYGADGTHAVSNGTSSTMQVANFPNEKLRIHYVNQPNGGSWRYRVNGGAWSSAINTAGTLAFQVVEISGLTGTNTIDIDVPSQGAGGVIISGFVGLNSTGVRTHRLGNGGLTAADANSWNWSIVGPAIADLKLDACLVMVASNESNEDYDPNLFETQLVTLGGNLATATAGNTYPMDRIFFGPGDNGRAALYNFSLYDAAMYRAAVTLGITHYSTYMKQGPYRADWLSGPNALYRNEIHPSEYGGEWMWDDLKLEVPEIINNYAFGI